MIEAWEAYAADLCKQSTDIRHDGMDGTKKRRSWFEYTDEESPVANANAASPYVTHESFYAATRQEQWIYTSELAILVNVNTSKGPLPAEIKKAKALAFNIGQQFEAKISEDFENGVTCELFDDLLESSLTPTAMIDQTAFGWLLTVKFVKGKPELDGTKWNNA